ncbi:Eco57I restriction-modification methylase domain-containing protein [Arthrobacter oryzae]|uniref:site-specific DNA-methyltransferase (adenine-specific) n=1 Tax=Arthrobacter oryzae TaxID=409290 RepID=A0A495E6S1_9MICC|nr:DNA methyltransferase [Arthrobacter oryzae]RKR12632.1 N-6 DNA methylase [Arthrobacter oryzae]
MSAAFQAITVVGGVVPPSLLGRIQAGEVNDARSMAPVSFHLAGTETVRDAASRTWMYLQGAWRAWRESDAAKRPDGQGAGTGDARQKWLLVLLRELGYGQVPATPGGLTIGGEAYPISHRWESVPIHLLGPGVDLDKRTPKIEGAARRAPQAMMQEFLNREDTYLWAILSNGLRLRLLRDSTALAGSAYIEFDLEIIFESDLYSEFQLFWQLCHQSRLDKRGGSEAPPSDCWLELWRGESVEAGARALDKLGAGVEKALGFLGSGFLRHPDNRWLVDALHSGDLSHRDFHKALLRTAYRLLFLFVVEDRGALLDPAATTEARHRYETYFSTQRLRKMSRTRDGGPHPDLWRTQKLVLGALGGDGLGVVGLPALGGLFDPDPRAARLAGQPHGDLLLGAELANQDFLKAIRGLGWVAGKTGRLQPVDYRHLGAEELGSVYESLLELVPRVDTETRSFELAHLAGNERKTTGSYYTPPSLVSALLDTALDPLLDQAVNGATGPDDAEARLLALTVCDPASGSGGFLVAAARRIARRLAEVRAGDNEPTPGEVQSALHDVVERCIYGVDMNDLAAELAKVSLWLEAMQPGKPLGFLDARIKIGNSLLGTTPALLAGGVPEGAFTVLEGDDKTFAAEAKKRNKAENTRKADRLFGSLGQDAFSFGGTQSAVAQMISQRRELVKPVASAEEARSRAKAYDAFDHSADMEQKRLHADAWCAAFVWPLKAGEAEPPTSSIVRQLGDSGISAGYAGTVARIRQLADEYRFFHWHLEFPEVFGDPEFGEDVGVEGWPGGFSCMLGNPPWEHIELKEREFFAAHSPKIAAAAGAKRKKLIEELFELDPILDREFRARKREIDGVRHFASNSGRYPLCGRGRVKTDPLFAELFRSMTHPMGRTGIIVPTGIATDHTTQFFFKDLVETSTIAALYDFENRAPLFVGVDSRYKFCLLTIAGRVAKEEVASFAFFLHDPADVSVSSFELSPEEIKLLNPNTGTLPIFRTRRDVEITLAIYRRVPVLIDENDSVGGNPWGVSFMQGLFNMTSDSHLFHTREQLESGGWVLDGNTFERTSSGQLEKMLPLYEAKMIHQFDHRWATYENGKTREVDPARKRDARFDVLPNSWVAEAEVEKAIQTASVPDTATTLGIRGITNSTNERTIISSIAPRVAFGNSCPRLTVRKGSASILSAVLNSFALDFAARPKVGGSNLNFFIAYQLPVLPPSIFDELCTWDARESVGSWTAARANELIFTTWSLANPGEEPFKWDEQRRSQLRAELDAGFFVLYGFDRDEIDYAMERFPISKRNDEVEFGEYRTKRLILDAYDAMQDAIKTGVAFESTLTPPPGQGPRHPAKEMSA